MLKFLPPELLPTYPQDCMGMTAFYLRHIATRRKVLRYIKHLDTAKPPWLPDSEFAQLDAELRHWYDNLPANLQFTPTTLYIRQETSQVGALCALHYAYHQTMCDLYRVGKTDPRQLSFSHQILTFMFSRSRLVQVAIANRVSPRTSRLLAPYAVDSFRSRTKPRHHHGRSASSWTTCHCRLVVTDHLV